MMYAPTEELMFQLDCLQEQIKKIEDQNEREFTSQMLLKFKNEHYGKPITDADLVKLKPEFRYIDLHCNSKSINDISLISVDCILLEPVGVDSYKLHLVIKSAIDMVETNELSSIKVWNNEFKRIEPVLISGFLINTPGVKREKSKIINNAWRIFKDLG